MSTKKKFLCSQCPQTFTRASNLQRHVACVHEDVRRFACTMCDKSFKRKRDLDGHMFAAHLQITPFVCEHPGCDRAFARQEQLRIHRKAHEYAASAADPASFVSPVTLAAAAAASAAHATAHAADSAADGAVPPPPPPPPAQAAQPARRRKRTKRSDDNDDSDDEYRDGYHATASNYRYAPPKQSQPVVMHPHTPHLAQNGHLLHATSHALHPATQLPNLLAPLHHMHLPNHSSHPFAHSTTPTANGASFPHINDSLLSLAFNHSHNHTTTNNNNHHHQHHHHHHHHHNHQSSHNLSAILSPPRAADEPDFKRPMLAHHDQLSRGLFALSGAPVPHSARASSSTLADDAAHTAATAAANTAATTATSPTNTTSNTASNTGAASKPSVGGTPTVLTAFLDAAHQNFLVKHENHVDALIDGRLLSLNHRFEEHDISTVIEFCDDATMQHTDNDCDHDHHGHDHHGKSHGEKKSEVLSPLEPAAHHQHAVGCGHIAVQHGDHTDFLVGHHLHHPAAGEDGHCVNHGHINMLSIDALYADGGLDATSWRELFAAESLFSASTATN